MKRKIWPFVLIAALVLVVASAVIVVVILFGNSTSDSTRSSSSYTTEVVLVDNDMIKVTVIAGSYVYNDELNRREYQALVENKTDIDLTINPAGCSAREDHDLTSSIEIVNDRLDRSFDYRNFPAQTTSESLLAIYDLTDLLPDKLTDIEGQFLVRDEKKTLSEGSWVESYSIDWL